jgi:hypothetical protein
VLTIGLLAPAAARAQEKSDCRIFCSPEFSIEPTVTISNLFGSPRVMEEDGRVARQAQETDFEVILSFGLPTRVSWLEFTVEAIFVPFDRDSAPDLELETNLTWLPAERTRGWISSHFDVIDKFSAAERPTNTRAYTHKLNFELDTSMAVFNWLPEGRWLRGVEVEGSLDYVATGLPRRGDVIEGGRFIDRASPWSFSIVFVIPVAPL